MALNNHRNAVRQKFTPQRFSILSVLLIGFGLLVMGLIDIPPGLTHDEAAHGWEALQILKGSPRYYFPLGYGREPLYAYLLAGVMGLIGIGPFTLRLVVPWAMVLALAGGYRWGKMAFGHPVALLGTAAWAVGFWPIAAGRQALRSGLIPLLMTVIALGTWRLLFVRNKSKHSDRLVFIAIAIAIGLLLHTYIAARILWALPLIFLLALWLTGRPAGGASARLLILTVIFGAALGAPLLAYLQLNPGLESRLDMLSRPLTALLAGDVTPLLTNSWAALKGVVWPGAGDHFLAYNIPGRPTLEPVAAVLALIGLGVAVWRWRRPGSLFLLLWLGLGLAPSLITGPTAGTTRNIGALPPLYLMVGLGGWTLLRQLPAGWWRPALGGVAIAAIAVSSLPAYFVTWGGSPDVRAAYRAGTVATLAEVEAVFPVEKPVVISSELPGPAHDPLLGDLLLHQPDRPLRWVDARRALLFPQGEPVDVIAPTGAELHPFFLLWSAPLEHAVVLDEGSALQLFRDQVGPPTVEPDTDPVTLSGAVTLLDVRWLSADVPPGGVGELLSVWRIEDPAALPQTEPAGFLDLAIFVHVIDEEGEIIFQEDRLDAPPATWRAGDVLVQIHQLTVPPESAVGSYDGRIGMYDRLTVMRLQTDDGRDVLPLPPLVVR